MATSLILNKRISTTLAKAKALRKYVEPILTKAKDDTTHSRRVAFSYLNDKESVKTLFDEVATKIADRPGGYTRILKTGNRLGDNADMCIIELVDYNELLLGDAPKKSKTRRSRRGKKSSTPTPAAEVEATEVVEVSEAEVVEENATEAVVEEVDQDATEEVEVQAETVVQEDEPEAEASADTEEPNDEKEDKDDSEKKN